MNLFSPSFSTSSDFDEKSKDGKDRCRLNSEKQRREEKTGEDEDESQPLINLCLGIGDGGGSNYFCNNKTNDREKDNNFDRIVMVEYEEEEEEVVVDDDQVVECRNYSVVRFTEEQLDELKRQLLIFKYMVWGLPVPLQLLLPIWRSVSSSFVPHHLDLYTRSSPFLLAFFREGSDYRQVMDPEPGRCRRTDGKKWRCHQSVIPNEKYCGKHMHRGSKRSRKLVEASPNFRTPNFINLNRTNNLSSDIRPNFPENLNKNGPTRVVMRAPAMTNNTAKSNDNDKQKNVSKHDIVAKERTVVNNLASGLDFSPKSVLQNDPSMQCPRVENCKTNPESELRCKRTDGKKWRCKKEVLPDKKYCAQHINRGKVRLEKPSLGTSSTLIEAKAKVSSGLDTNLKISLPARPADGRNIIKDSVARNGSSCSSSEATESDESADFSGVIVLSP